MSSGIHPQMPDPGWRQRAWERWWRHGRPLWQAAQWPLIVGLAFLAVGLGYWGFDLYLSGRGIDRSVGDTLYLAFQLFPLESGSVDPPVPWQLGTARLVAPGVAAWAAISAVATIFRDQLTRLRVRLFAHDHVVICGLGRTGALLAEGFRTLRHRVVVIEMDEKNSAVGETRERGATVLFGNANDRTVLGTAAVRRASHMFAVCGEDRTNADIALDARALSEGRTRPPLNCFVRVLDADLAELMRWTMVAGSARVPMRLEVFNPAERGAAPLLDEHPPFDANGETRFGPPHLLIVGLGQMGARLVLDAARRWREIVGPGGDRLRVTVVDNKGQRHVDDLLDRHERLRKVCDFSFRTVDVDEPEFEKAAFIRDADGQIDVTGVYVCLGDDARGLAAALRLRRAFGARDVPIVVRTKHRGGLGGLLDLAETGAGAADVRVFGLLDLVCHPGVVLRTTNEILARAIHEDYVRSREAEGDTRSANASMAPWEELPENLRESNRRQADDVARKLQATGCVIRPATDWECEPFGFTGPEVERLAEMEHERWSAERTAAGWTHGPEKDVRRKRSPYLVPWDELSDAIKQRDRDPVEAMPGLLARAGLCVVRVREVQM